MNASDKRNRMVTALIGATFAAALAASGCGSGIGVPQAAKRPLVNPVCGAGAGDSDARINLALLDWSGGHNPIYPESHFPGVDLSLFELAEGGTLADRGGEFTEQVRAKVNEIFCDLETHAVVVVNGEDHQVLADAVMHITQALSPSVNGGAGEAEYDPCNIQDDNWGLVFAEQLRRVGEGSFYDEWVNVFANTIAHEIGHTLGYWHVDQDDVAVGDHDDAHVEIMLASHSKSELRSEQRFVVAQDYCPQRSTSRSIADEAGIVECGHTYGD